MRVACRRRDEHAARRDDVGLEVAELGRGRADVARTVAGDRAAVVEARLRDVAEDHVRTALERAEADEAVAAADVEHGHAGSDVSRIEDAVAHRPEPLEHALSLLL